MARVARLFQFIGVFFLLVAAGLLVVPCVTAPVLSYLSLFTVTGRYDPGSIGYYNLDYTTKITYGAFGYCAIISDGLNNVDSNIECSTSGIGYWNTDATDVIEALYGENSTQIPDDVQQALTSKSRAFVLLPLAVGFSGLAALVGMCRCVLLGRTSAFRTAQRPPPSRAGRALDVLGAVLAWLALAFAVASLACAHVGFGRVRDALDADRAARTDYARGGDAATGSSGAAAWIWLVGDVSLFFGAVFAVLSAWRGRQERRDKVWEQS